MKDFQVQALRSLKYNINDFSVKEAVDLAVVSSKKVALLVSKNQYLDLLGSFGIFLNHKNLLLVGSVDLKESSPPGFRSTYDRLMEKLSLSLYLGLDDIDVFVCIKNTTNLTYKKTIKSIKVDTSVSFESLVSHIQKSCSHNLSFGRILHKHLGD